MVTRSWEDNPAVREQRLVVSVVVVVVLMFAGVLAVCGLPYLMLRDLVSVALEAPCP